MTPTVPESPIPELVEGRPEMQPTRLSRRRSERGATILLFTLAAVALLALTAMVVDLGNAYQDKSAQQSATDAAVLAATHHLLAHPGDFVGARNVARNLVVQNYDLAASEWDTCADPDPLPITVDRSDECISFRMDGTKPFVRVRMPTQRIDTAFGGALGVDQIQVDARAGADGANETAANVTTTVANTPADPAAACSSAVWSWIWQQYYQPSLAQFSQYIVDHGGSLPPYEFWDGTSAASTAYTGNGWIYPADGQFVECSGITFDIVQNVQWGAASNWISGWLSACRNHYVDTLGYTTTAMEPHCQWPGLPVDWDGSDNPGAPPTTQPSPSTLSTSPVVLG